MWEVGRYLGYTGRDADDGVKAALSQLGLGRRARQCEIGALSYHRNAQSRGQGRAGIGRATPTSWLPQSCRFGCDGEVADFLFEGA